MTLPAFLGALGLLIAAEGLVYAVFPGAVRRAMAALLALPDERLRQIGLATLAAGAALVAVAAFVRG